MIRVSLTTPSWAIGGPFETEATLINMQHGELLTVFARMMRESADRYGPEQCITAIRYACIAERILRERPDDWPLHNGEPE